MNVADWQSSVNNGSIADALGEATVKVVMLQREINKLAFTDARSKVVAEENKRLRGCWREYTGELQAISL